MGTDKFPETARVHEATVQKVAKGEIPAVRVTRTRTSAHGGRSSKVEVTKVRPDVWADAKALLEALRPHGYTHIEIISDEEVIVR